MVSEHPLAPLLINEFLESIGQPALGEGDETSCYICSEAYLSGDSPEFPIALSCGHKAGSNCIMKWLSPLRNTGRNSCPQCRAAVFAEWNRGDFPPPPPVVPMGNGPAEQAAQVEIASTALSNVFAMLPPGGSAEFGLRRFGRLTLRAVRPRERDQEVRQARDASMDGRERAVSEAVPGAAERVIDRPRPAVHRDEASGRGTRRAWLDHVDRAETRNPATYRLYRPEYGRRQVAENTRGHDPAELGANTRGPGTHLNSTRIDRAETAPARNMLGQLNGMTEDEAVSPTPEQTDRRAPRIPRLGQTPPYLYPPVPASSAGRTVRSSTASAVSTGLSTDSSVIFETYQNYWALEGNREGRP